MTVDDLQQMRSNVLKHYLIGIPLSLAAGLAVWYFAGGNFMMFLFPAVFGVIITVISTNGSEKRFRRCFKELFVEKALQEVFSDLKYDPDKGLDKSILKKTGMIDLADEYSSNDLISGKYNGIGFTQADVHIQEEHTTSNGKTTHTELVTIFQGRYMIFDFNKNFTHKLEIIQNGFMAAKVPGGWFKRDLDRIELEDSDFNRRFKTYTTSGSEAFYILTPTFMEHIKTFDDRTRGKLLFCFIDNKLHVAIDSREDSFELSAFGKIDPEEIRHQVDRDIRVITDLADDLRLEDDLFN